MIYVIDTVIDHHSDIIVQGNIAPKAYGFEKIILEKYISPKFAMLCTILKRKRC